jgi:hypothetical protein
VQPGFELGLFNCEQSSRQMWTLNGDGTMRLTVPSSTDDGVSALAEGSILCIARGDLLRPFLRVRICDNSTDAEYSALSFSLVPINEGSSESTPSGYSLVQFQLNTDNAVPSQCLEVQSIASGFIGGLMVLSECDSTSRKQGWFYRIFESQDPQSLNQMSDVISATAGKNEGNLCLTAGWPFLTATAFSTPDGNTAVIVMNESPQTSFFSLIDQQSGTLVSGINGRSIQTIIY